MKVLILLFSIFGLSLGEVLFGYKTTEAYNNTIELDGNGNYFLYWKFNDSHITFEVHVKTNGWVGFGLSDNGNMYPGDVVVGWVDQAGKTYFSDRHTTGHSMPIKDASQDWQLLFGEERDEWTVLKFVRKIETCDTTEDLEIPKGTTRIIYAFGKTDPISDDAITYHGATSRGTKSVNLLSTIKVPANMPDDVIHFEFLNDNYLLPNASTTYYCRGFFMPEFGPHHMIKGEDSLACDICEKQYKSKSSLSRHKRSHKDATFHCSLCEKAFSRSDAYKRHVEIHSKKHLCHECGKSFSSGKYLKEHFQTQHEKQRKYKCDTCDKACTTKYRLRAHMVSHHGVKPFVCDVCQKRFTHNYTLIRHQKNNCKQGVDQPGTERLTCDICKKTLKDRKSLKQHSQIHSDPQYVCHVCSRKFKWKSGFNVHKKVCHL